MKSLYIGNSVQILPSYLQPEGTFSDSDSEHEHDGNVYEKQGFILQAPELRKLCIRDLFVTRGPTYFDLLLKPLTDLTHLDLSGAFHKEGMENFCWLLCLPELVSLILHNVQGDKYFFIKDENLGPRFEPFFSWKFYVGPLVPPLMFPTRSYGHPLSSSLSSPLRSPLSIISEEG